MPLHARLSLSASAGWANCPDYPNAQIGIPDAPSEIAQKGTCSHWVLEQSLIFNAPPREFIGKMVLIEDSTGDIIVLKEDEWDEGPYVFHPHEDLEAELVGHVWTVTEQMADYAQVAATHAYRIAQDIDGELKPERRVNPGILLDRDDCYGTADITIVGEREFHIYDLKTGFQRVLAQGNFQLLLYAIGVLADMPPEQRMQMKEVTIGIIQPTMAEGYQITTSTFSILDLWIWVDWFRKRAKLTDEEHPVRIPGETQCKWCRAKPTCPALQKSMFGGLFELNEEHETREQIVVHGEAVTTREPQELGLETLSAILELIPLARDWLTAVESYALDLMMEGTAVPGHKLVRKLSRKKWTEDDATVIKRLTTNLKIPKDDVIAPEKPIGPPKVQKIVANYEKLYPDKKPLTDLKRKNFDKMWIKPLGEITIAPESDPRPAIARSKEDMAAGMLDAPQEVKNEVLAH